MLGLVPENTFPPKGHRAWIVSRVVALALIHLAGFTAVYAVAYALRFDFAIPSHMQSLYTASLLWVVGLKLILFYLTGNFFGWWRYVTFADLAALLRASTISLLSIAAIDYFLPDDRFPQIPRSILLLDWGMTILLFGGLRSCVRFSREHFLPAVRRVRHPKAIFVGADEFSVVMANRIHSDVELAYKIIGFVDSDVRKTGSRLGGLKVLGTLDEVGQIAADYTTKHILVVSGSLSGAVMRKLMQACVAAELTVKVLPALGEILHSNQHVYVRDVDINDLLRRDPVQLDTKALAELFTNKTVMVTGAGGSIGSEICRQLLKFQPEALVLVERAENSLFNIERELIALKTPASLHPCIADILDRERMEQLFSTYRPEVIFHAAAHKHVPMMEMNVGEAVKNNVLGTKQLADLAHAYGVERFVLISTDKAVNPSSVMGVSKQLAERYVHAMSQESPTRFVAVRFGNVLGSAGSVVPIFQEQIRRGGPITITDERMTRYFMTIPEASQLVLQAATMGRGGEIFVLDMGEPVRIVDLARDLIRLSGLSSDAIEIAFTGVRPGEKLYEELYFEDEETLPTTHSKLRAVYHRPYTKDEVCQVLTELMASTNGTEESIRRLLCEVVPEYRPPKRVSCESEIQAVGIQAATPE